MRESLLSQRMLVLAAVVASFAPCGGSVAAEKAIEPGQLVYEKKATWAETMLFARASYLRQMEADLAAAGAPRAKPFNSDLIYGDGPGQKVSVDVTGWQRMRLVSTLEQGGGNCHIWGDAVLIDTDGIETRLSSLKPIAVFVGWGQLLADRNWQDEPLKIGSRRFKHGIWVHSNSDVCYALNGKYERFEAWVGMDAARATGAARFKVMASSADLLPVVWRLMAGDYPAQAQWMTDDAGRGRETQWFLDAASTRQDQALIQRALSQIGPGAGLLQKRLETLRRTRVPADDPRWLNLYATACRYRACLAPLKQIGAADLRRLLLGQLDEISRAQTPPDDPQWSAVESKAARLAEVLGPVQGVDMSTLQASMDNLLAALPRRIVSGPQLVARLRELQQRWEAVTPMLSRGDKSAIDDLATLCQQMKQLRHDVLCSVRGMSEFLAVPAHAGLEKEWQSQFEALAYDLRNTAHFARVAPEVFRPEASISETDRDPADVVLRRTAALLADLKKTAAAPGLAGLEKDLAELQAANPAVDLKNSEARFVLFADACRLRRQIALKNPLLDFGQVLFIKRHRALLNHMCDQYYGMAATPGGGLYVLSGAFGPNPQVRDVLANSVVERGRLKGQKLLGGSTTPPSVSFDAMGNRRGEDKEGGSFLSPELSYDGKTILFAFVECQGDMNHRHHTDPLQGHWHEGRCYHVFKVNADGSNLEQLTDGTWNDFDPCWLPNGRIAFMSERRGGYLRCGRVCPTYTLYDMAADGSDITCLSFHETNEWHPSVTHDGRILYTRWDYVDRHGCTAHLPWITTLDGRDSRAVHGNFTPRGARPDMEVDCRAIPGSHKFVATAAPHHGQAYGSLVLVDPRIPDDDGMAPVRRITPDVGFPETQGGREAYGTPWPLSEDYYLCIYDAGIAMGKPSPRGSYGIYLVDSFGNKELIYRDPEIGSQSPIPFRARPMPPVAPDVASRRPDSDPSQRAATPQGRAPEATIAVVNVYESLKPWPEGTKIKELRVMQIFPMSVPSGGPPHETGLREPSAGDSVVLARSVLGTVPVEDDGSAHLVVPAHKEIFFQALDEQGLAVQSMRSATYLHEGEHLVCIGCHEPKHRTPLPLKTPTPLAMRREPSRLSPDVDGSDPISYPRLVQPVLDKHCVKCHEENKGKAPNLGREPITRKWYASYNSLAQKYGFYSYGHGHRTTPGQFGARASKLYEHLRKGHHDVKLSDEEMHRLALWLDGMSMFYGVYEKEGGEAQLRGEVARPTLE